jgi:hypothetical protein
MRRIVISLAALAAIFGGSARATAGLVYDNGPVNGTIDAFNVSSGLAVTDSFTVASSTDLVEAQVGLWVVSGDVPSTINWMIGTTQFGSDIAAGTATPFDTLTYLFTNSEGADVYESTFTILGSVDPGTTYWLTLQNGSTADGGFLFWDENVGPSVAVDSALGSIPSESFQLFDDSVVAAPEPASLTLLALGIPGVWAASRRWAGQKAVC